MINRSPKVMSLTTDLHKDLVQVPLPLRTMLHALRSSLADLVREISAEAVHPVTNRFVANIDPALVKQVFDIPQRQRESDIHHDRKLDDFGGRLEVAERVLAHIQRLNARYAHLKPGSFDNAIITASWMISGDVLKYRKGDLVIFRG